MASTTSSPNTFLSSPRNQRMLMWISGAVLVIGLGLFLGVFFTRGTGQPVGVSNLSSSPPSDTNPYQNGTKLRPHVAPSKTALQVAHTFLVTAVARKHLDVAYRLVGPDLKGGLSLAEWRQGNPVPYYPAKNLKNPDITVHSSTKNQLLLEVGLVSAPHSGVAKSVKSLGFQMELDRIGGKWLVTYFQADYKIPTLDNPGN